MSAPEVVLIDYGIGNLLSVRRGLEHCGAAVRVTSDPQEVSSASRIVLPGVGAFADGMGALSARALDAAVKEAAGRGAPVLGICLGMQMLVDESEEFGVTCGLGLIPGRVIAIPDRDIAGQPQKIPHIGWNALVEGDGGEHWRASPLKHVKPGDAVYFVHSFMANPADDKHRIGDCLYGGIRVSAVIGRDNVFGCQFHPEKSGVVGLKVLRGFLLQ